jgi:hypothetical protein
MAVQPSGTSAGTLPARERPYADIDLVAAGRLDPRGRDLADRLGLTATPPPLHG